MRYRAVHGGEAENNDALEIAVRRNDSTNAQAESRGAYGCASIHVRATLDRNRWYGAAFLSDMFPAANSTPSCLPVAGTASSRRAQ